MRAIRLEFLWASAMLVAACGGSTTGATSERPVGVADAGGSTSTIAPGDEPQPSVNQPASGGSASSATVAPTPACDGGAITTVFARPAAVSSMEIALTPSYVYWDDGATIMRQWKNGSAAETVTATTSGAGIIADANRLYWRTDLSIVSAPIDAPSAVTQLGADAVPGAWTGSGGAVFYLMEGEGTTGAGGGPNAQGPSQIIGVRSTGGAPFVSIEQPTASALGPLAADTTGVYW